MAVEGLTLFLPLLKMIELGFKFETLSYVNYSYPVLCSLFKRNIKVQTENAGHEFGIHLAQPANSIHPEFKRKRCHHWPIITSMHWGGGEGFLSPMPSHCSNTKNVFASWFFCPVHIPIAISFSSAEEKVWCAIELRKCTLCAADMFRTHFQPFPVEGISVASYSIFEIHRMGQNVPPTHADSSSLASRAEPASRLNCSCAQFSVVSRYEQKCKVWIKAIVFNSSIKEEIKCSDYTEKRACSIKVSVPLVAFISITSRWP